MTSTYTRLVLSAAIALLGVSAAQAETWPAKQVTIVVPYTAGGAADSLAREIAERMRARFKQTVVVDNRPGAGTTIASAHVAKAAPDGYTVLFAASSLGIAPSLYKNVGYDPLKSFEPVSLLASITHVLVVGSDVPAKTIPEFIGWAKAHPGQVNYASVGAGSTTHLEAELFKKMAGIEMTHVPYKGSKPALTDIIGGQVQAMFDAYSSSAPLATDGRLKILGVTTEARSKAVPSVPTIAEQGVPGYDVMTWMGLLVPAGTPKEVVAILNQSVNEALANPDVQKNLTTLGFESIGGTPEQFSAYLKKDVAKWSTFIKTQSIVAD